MLDCSFCQSLSIITLKSMNMYHSDNSCYTYSIFLSCGEFLSLYESFAVRPSASVTMPDSLTLSIAVCLKMRRRRSTVLFTLIIRICRHRRMVYFLYLYSDNIINAIYLIQVIRHSHIHQDQESSFLLDYMIEERKKTKIF